MTDKLIPPTLTPINEAPEGKPIWIFREDGSRLFHGLHPNPDYGVFERTVDTFHIYGDDGLDLIGLSNHSFILAPVKPNKRREIWDDWLSHEGFFQSDIFDYNVSSVEAATNYELKGLAAFILNELGLYDDEIRAKLTEAFHE